MKQLNINPQQAQQAWKIAKDMGVGVHTKEQALNLLKQKGIDNPTLEKIGSYINSPMADMAASVMNVNINKVRQDFNSLVGSGNVKTTPKNDNLTKYRNGYKQL